MGSRASFRIEHGANGPACTIDIHDRSLLGRAAKFELAAECKVSKHSGVDARAVLHSRGLKLDSARLRLQLPGVRLRGYSYRGRYVTLRLLTRLVVDDGVLFDTELTEEQQIGVGLLPALSGEAKEIVEPRDRIEFFANLRALTPRRQILTVVGALVGGLAVLAIAAAGIYDQLTADTRSLRSLAEALAASGVLAAALWAALRGQLRRYMTFRLAWKHRPIRRGQAVRASQLLRGRTRLPLENVTLRIVAANMERGEVRRGEDDDESLEPFAEPARAVVLYAKRVAYIPAGAQLAGYFDDPVDFDRMFRALYPPFYVSSTHGLAVYWEAQLLHPQFVDQELQGWDVFEYEDFLKA
jgi:hypothetical protein